MLCTANQCRSPMAEALLRRRVDASGLGARVHSAGFLFDGEPPTQEAIETMAGYGLDIEGHRSRVVTADMASAADLIITMTGRHVAEIAGVAPSEWRRAFPLRDLVRRAQVAPRHHGEALDEWALRVGAGRTPTQVLSASDVDIADPIGLPRSAYERTAVELDDLLGRLVISLSGPGIQAPRGSGASGSIP